MKKLAIALAVLFPAMLYSQLVAKSITGSNGVTFGFYEYKPTNYSTTIKYPLIIFLHGISERGNGTTELYKAKSQGLPKNIDAGHKMTFTWNGKTETFLVLVPQCRKTDTLWYPFYIQEMLKYARANMSIDTNRIILTGLSMGGGGVWMNTSSSIADASRFAAIAPVAAACLMNNGRNIALGKPSVYAFHATNDTTKVALTSCTVNAIKEINLNNPPMKAVATYYNSTSHVIWPRAYDTTYKYQNPNIYEWFLNQNRKLAPNKYPIAKAGNDTLIHSATGKAILKGTLSSDPDGTILRYIWRKIGGPTGGTITNGNTATATVSGLKTAGVHVFELEVVDNRASWTFDTIKVTVNASPIANAGPDASITLPTNIYKLNGSASSDPDGTIASYKWTRVSGPNTPLFVSPTTAITDVKNLIQGIYRFRITVTDNKGGTKTDDMYLTVNAATAAAITRSESHDSDAQLKIFVDNGSKTLHVQGFSGLSRSSSINMFDVNGRSVRLSPLSNDRVKLDGVNRGIYVIEIRSGDKRIVQKVFVE